MNYFQVKRAEQAFCEFRELAVEYWENTLPDDRGPLDRFDGVSKPESEASFELRQHIGLMLPDLNNYARRMGLGVTAQSVPPPRVGGAILPVNMLESVIDPNRGHGTIAQDRILDTINYCIGQASLLHRRAFWRMVCPVYWPIDIIAFIIRLPFLILRRAGLPAKVEENVISQIIKTILTVGILLLLAYLGLEKYIGHALGALGR